MPKTDPTARRQELLALLGELPERKPPRLVRTVRTEQHPTYTLEKLVLDLNGRQPVPAYFIHPQVGSGPFPTILYNHAHGGDYQPGKDEFIRGRESLQSPPWAEELALRGYAGLCVDHWAFGERADRTESDIFKEMLWHGQVMWGMMVFDSLCAIDYLVTRSEVDVGRLGTLGLSMGSTMAWWVAALDPRIKVCVDICCLTDFQALVEAQGLQYHGIYYYVPNLLRHFTTTQINALIVPRAHLSLAGNLDTLTPPAGLDRIDTELRKAYTGAGHPDAWKLYRQDVGHQETPEMRAEALAWLQRWL